MLNIIIIPAFVVAMLAVYLTAEESVERRLGRRLSPHALDKARQWTAEQIAIRNEKLDAREREINAAIDSKFDSLINRARMWLAWKILP